VVAVYDANTIDNAYSFKADPRRQSSRLPRKFRVPPHAIWPAKSGALRQTWKSSNMKAIQQIGI
jgi:hypothetical protein